MVLHIGHSIVVIYFKLQCGGTHSMTKMQETIFRLTENQTVIMYIDKVSKKKFKLSHFNREQQRNLNNPSVLEIMLLPNFYYFGQFQSHSFITRTSNYHLPTPPPALKLDVPRFDGTDPLSGLEANHCFGCHHTLINQRITISPFYMDGLAFGWSQQMHRNGQLSSWNKLLCSLEIHFASS